MTSGVPTEAQVFDYFSQLSNWGRWGAADRLGTLNYITNEKLVKAGRLIRTGQSVSLSHVMEPGDPGPQNDSLLQRYMIYSGESRLPQYDPDIRFQAGREFIGVVPHGSNTHLDWLSHMMWDGKMYNGIPASAVNGPQGATELSAHDVVAGVNTRGIVLDITAVREVDYLAVGETVLPDDLEAAERLQGVTVESGDVLLLFTGFAALAEENGYPPEHGGAGYSAACLPWLHEREVALISSDNINDAQPSGYKSKSLVYPVHCVALTAMGLPLVDNMKLHELVEMCRTLQRWEFFFAMPTLRIVGTTSSLVNPIAIF